MQISPSLPEACSADVTDTALGSMRAKQHEGINGSQVWTNSVHWVPAGRKQIVIEVADIDADSEEELEDVETPDIKKKNRWRRVAQAATKQCLRCSLLPCCISHS